MIVTAAAASAICLVLSCLEAQDSWPRWQMMMAVGNALSLVACKACMIDGALADCRQEQEEQEEGVTLS